MPYLQQANISGIRELFFSHGTIYHKTVPCLIYKQTNNSGIREVFFSHVIIYQKTQKQTE